MAGVEAEVDVAVVAADIIRAILVTRLRQQVIFYSVALEARSKVSLVI